MINNLLLIYLGSCIGCYISSCYWNKESFPGAKASEVLLGILGAFIWPLIFYVTYKQNKFLDELEKM